VFTPEIVSDGEFTPLKVALETKEIYPVLVQGEMQFCQIYPGLKPTIDELNCIVEPIQADVLNGWEITPGLVITVIKNALEATVVHDEEDTTTLK
jgi:hypothetical protein